MKFSTFAFLILALAVPASGFGNALFQQAPTAQLTFPSKTEGVEIELPDFDELFGRIQQVSPLARVAVEGGEINGKRGFAAIDNSWTKDLKWKTLESNKNRDVQQIEKIDSFQGVQAPILRFRGSMKGPCVGEAFANFVMNLDDRKKWDAQIDNVYEAYPIHDLEAANIAMGFKYGDCSRLGVGHCLTKSNMGIDAREQLTICGINDFDDGSCLIWGTEMEEWHNHLFPPGRRSTRAKSHIFSTTLVPTSADCFDIEYVLQLEIGGNIPTWLTTPIVTDNVKKLFACAKDFYLDKDGALSAFLAEKARRNDSSGYSLLMTP